MNRKLFETFAMLGARLDLTLFLSPDRPAAPRGFYPALVGRYSPAPILPRKTVPELAAPRDTMQLKSLRWILTWFDVRTVRLEALFGVKHSLLFDL